MHGSKNCNESQIVKRRGKKRRTKLCMIVSGMMVLDRFGILIDYKKTGLQILCFGMKFLCETSSRLVCVHETS